MILVFPEITGFGQKNQKNMKKTTKKVDIVSFYSTIDIGDEKMGRPKKVEVEKTPEQLAHEKKLKELELNVIKQVIEARKSQKLSQRIVGERAGIIRETVAKIENNLNSPQINTLIKLLQPIGYTIGVIPLPKEEDETDGESTEN